MLPHTFRRALLRVAPIAVAAGLVLAAAGCGTDDPTAVATTGIPTPDDVGGEMLGPPQIATLLRRTRPLDRDVSVSAVVRPGAGARIEIRDAGFQLDIPSSALRGTSPVTITVTALAGDGVAYSFEPHGLRFVRPLEARQELRGTTWSERENPDGLEAIYFGHESRTSLPEGTVRVREVFPASIITSGHRARWDIPHFSGYGLSTARTTVDDGI